MLFNKNVDNNICNILKVFLPQTKIIRLVTWRKKAQSLPSTIPIYIYIRYIYIYIYILESALYIYIYIYIYTYLIICLHALFLLGDKQARERFQIRKMYAHNNRTENIFLYTSPDASVY